MVLVSLAAPWLNPVLAGTALDVQRPVAIHGKSRNHAFQLNSPDSSTPCVFTGSHDLRELETVWFGFPLKWAMSCDQDWLKAKLLSKRS